MCVIFFSIRVRMRLLPTANLKRTSTCYDKSTQTTATTEKTDAEKKVASSTKSSVVSSTRKRATEDKQGSVAHELVYSMSHINTVVYAVPVFMQLINLLNKFAD